MFTTSATNLEPQVPHFPHFGPPGSPLGPPTSPVRSRPAPEPVPGRSHPGPRGSPVRRPMRVQHASIGDPKGNDNGRPKRTSNRTAPAALVMCGGSLRTTTPARPRSASLPAHATPKSSPVATVTTRSPEESPQGDRSGRASRTAGVPPGAGRSRRARVPLDSPYRHQRGNEGDRGASHRSPARFPFHESPDFPVRPFESRALPCTSRTARTRKRRSRAQRWARSAKSRVLPGSMRARPHDRALEAHGIARAAGPRDVGAARPAAGRRGIRRRARTMGRVQHGGRVGDAGPMPRRGRWEGCGTGAGAAGVGGSKRGACGTGRDRRTSVAITLWPWGGTRVSVGLRGDRSAARWVCDGTVCVAPEQRRGEPGPAPSDPWL